ncbi:MAG: DHA2 family efflux MFS transporter permease subunit [Actinobacteria bacterium]|nr:MAG: DHA2 family efflux MFS transporter permease subunit [Actinomycetota bacterium]
MQIGLNSSTTDAGNDRPIWPILLAVGAGTFMSALDSSVVNTVLPVIRGAFRADFATIQWVVTVYLLVVSGLLLTFGRLGDLRGHKSVYSAGFVVFVAGSVLSALATSASALIGFRAVQGLGAAMLFANSPAILTKNVPAARRGQALGLAATMTYLGLTVGPPLGGLLTQTFGWQAIFYINVPIGLGALLLTWRFVPYDRAEVSEEKFDPAGAVLFMAGLVALLFALDQGHDLGWASPLVAVSFCAAVLSLASFVFVETRARFPMLDLSLFRSRVFSAATGSALLNYISVYTIVFLMPFYLIQGRHLTPSRAGLFLTVQAVTMAVIAPISGTLSDRIGTRVPAATGMGLLAAGLLLLSGLGPVSPPALIAGALFVSGLGTGIFISPNNSALMGAAPRRRQGIAAGVLAEARNVGMVLGVGLAGAIFTTVAGPTGSVVSSPGLYKGVSAAFAVVAGVALAGTIVAAVGVRGRGEASEPASAEVPGESAPEDG